MGRSRIWLLLLCNASLATCSTADTPYVYDEQLLPGEDQPELSQLPPSQYATRRFRSESNDNNFEAYRSQANKSPYTSSFGSYPSTRKEAYPLQAQYDPTIKEATDYPASLQPVPTSVLEEKNSAIYGTEDPLAYRTKNILPIYKYMRLRYAPFSAEVKQFLNNELPDLRNDTPGKPIAVVPFKPPKRKPNKLSAQPPRPEFPLAPSASNPSPSAPYSAPYAAPSAPYAAPSAPYAAPSAPYAAPSAPYVAPSAPYAAPSAPHAAPLTSAPSALYPPHGRAKEDAVAHSIYYTDPVGSEGDFRSVIFLKNSDILVPAPTFIFMRVRGRGLFDVGSPFRLGTSSYSYFSPENVPVYMLDVSRR